MGDRDELVREFGRVMLSAIDQIREAWEAVAADLDGPQLSGRAVAEHSIAVREVLALGDGPGDPNLAFLSTLQRPETVAWRWQTDQRRTGPIVEPGVGAKVRDRDGRVWEHVEHGFDGTRFYGWWHLEGSDEPESWARVAESAPLELIEVGHVGDGYDPTHDPVRDPDGGSC